MEKSSPVDWQYLATESEQAENIRLHSLEPGDDLPQLLEEFKESYSKAVVLVNSEDSYEVPASIVSSVGTPLFPLFIVTKSDGEEILRCLERHEGDSIYARVDAENQVDAGSGEQVDPALNQKSSRSPQAAKQSVDSSISE